MVGFEKVSNFFTWIGLESICLYRNKGFADKSLSEEN